MITTTDMGAISALDLEAIKSKLMHRASGKGWSQQRADAVEFEYRRFLFLMKCFPVELIAPSVDVDKFWHQHILDTMKYAADCEHVFGYFLHHFPYLGMRGEQDETVRERAGARMRELRTQIFGAGTDQALSYCAASQTAYCAAGTAAYCAATQAYCAAANETTMRAQTGDAYCAATAGAA